MQPRRFLLAGTAGILALSAWVSRGALAVTDASAWPRRVGLLPSRWVPLIVGIVALASLVPLARMSRRALLPLLIPVLLILPWIPVPMPAAALLWTGPIVAWVWVATAIATVIAAWPRSWSEWRVARLARDARWGGGVALALAFALYLAGAWAVSGIHPGGDEPHYLVITQSLLKDGDLQIENNHRQEDYKAYFGGELRPDFLHRGENGEIYSIHAPGLPALVLPAFAAAGYRGVIVFLALLSAIGTWLVWRTGYRLTGSVGAAWFGWAAVALSVPFFFHASAVYPDPVAAVIVMAAVTALLSFETITTVGAEKGRAWPAWGWALLGGALGLLPWLHTRYAALAGVLGVCLALRLLARRAWARVVALVVPLLVGIAAWFGYFYAIYGEFSPAAAYGHYTQSQISNIPRGLVGLLFDAQFGLFPYAPVYLVAIAGFVSLFRVRLRLALEIAAVLLTYLLAVAAYHMWWGGWSAPARFLVPVLLMLGVPAAVFWSRQRAAGKMTAASALVIALISTATLAFVDWGRLVINDRSGVALWLAYLTPVVDLARALPSFHRDGPWAAFVGAMIWLAALLLAALAIRVLARRLEARGRDVTSTLMLAGPLLFALAIMVAATLTWAKARVGGSTPTPASLALLRTYDPARRPVGVQFAPLRRIAPEQVPGRLSLESASVAATDQDAPVLVLSDVPAGTYRLSPSVALAAQGVMELTVGSGRTAVERWTLDPAARGREFRVSLPVGVNGLIVRGDAAVRRSTPKIELEPVAIVPEVARFMAPRAVAGARYQDLAVFSFDALPYLEGPGMWLPGGVPVRLAFAGPAGATVLRVVVRNCPFPNRVTMRAQDHMEVLTLGPGEVRVVEWPVNRANGGAVVEITAERGYRPADVDPASRDLRYLGVWIEGTTTK